MDTLSAAHGDPARVAAAGARVGLVGIDGSRVVARALVTLRTIPITIAVHYHRVGARTSLLALSLVSASAVAIAIAITLALALDRR